MIDEKGVNNSVGLAFLRLTDSSGPIRADRPGSPAPAGRRGYGQSHWWRRTVPAGTILVVHNLKVADRRLPITGEGAQPDRGDTGEHMTLIDGRPSPRLVCSPEPHGPAQGTSAVLRAPGPCSRHRRIRGSSTRLAEGPMAARVAYHR